MQRIASNHIASNRIDQQYTHLIQNAIEKYESTSGYTIKYIATANDKNPTWSYSDIQYVIYDTNTRAFVVDWADVNMLNYYEKRNYMKVAMDDSVFTQYFKDKNWNSFNSDEQLVFDKETMYWIKY